MSIPRYDENDKEIGIEEILEIPILPVEVLSKEQLEIISAAGSGVESFDDLIIKLNPQIKKGQKSLEVRGRGLAIILQSL